VQGDIERWPYRYFVNPACDLLKYVYFFSAEKELLMLLETPPVQHWKNMIHSAIGQATQQGPLPYFEKAFVEIEIITPKGSNNVCVWDTSNRAINVVINNLKGIFFHDDDNQKKYTAHYGPFQKCVGVASS